MNSENNISKFINESRDKLIKVLLPSIIGYMIISVFIIVSFSYVKGYTNDQECFIIATLAILVIVILGILFTIYLLNSKSIISEKITKNIKDEAESIGGHVKESYAKINKEIENLLTLTTKANAEYEKVKKLFNPLKTEIEKSLDEIKKSKPDDNTNKANT